MYCRYCGEEIDDDEVYCPNCGELVWEPALDEAHAAGVRKSSRRKTRIVAIIVVAAFLLLAVCPCCIIIYSHFAEANGTLVVNASPEGAKIYVDLRDSGLSPQEISVSSGTTHTLTVVADGYRIYEQMFKVGPNEVLILSPVLVSSSYSADFYAPTYQWKYNGFSFSLPLAISKDKYDYYQGLGHMTNNLSKYATDSYNREIVADIAKKLTAQADALGLSSYDRIMLAASFVQNIPYQTDKETKGVDEYARYPVETLVDGVADCEDSSVLLASILKEMGYDVIIVAFDGHVGIGIAFDDYLLNGASFIKEGVKYYYLETVSPGWDIGEIDEKYLDLPFRVFPVN